MMKLTAEEQHEIQVMLANFAPSERAESVVEARRILDACGYINATVGMDSDIEKQAAAAIEVICRVESMESGSGSFYRLRRRLSLVSEYFSPSKKY